MYIYIYIAYYVYTYLQAERNRQAASKMLYASFDTIRSLLTQAERNRRAASMVLSLIGQSMGLLKPTWNDLSFGKKF